MNEVLGYDCDGFEIEEYQILRSIFANDIPIEELKDDPRFYCALVADDGNAYAISVYDFQYKDIIRKYENIPEDEEVPTIIKPISEMVNYECAYYGEGYPLFYEFDRKELKDKLNKLLKKKSQNKQNIKNKKTG